MKPLYSLRFSNFRAIALALLVLSPHGAFASSESSTPSSLNPGPRSRTEADFLFQEAQDAHTKAQANQELRSLERFRDRYPSDSRMLEVDERLIQNYKLSHRPEDVIKTAKQMLHLKLTAEQKHATKLSLASAYFDQKKYAEAQIVAEEILKDSPAEPNFISASFLKLSCLVQNHRLKEAHGILDHLKSYKLDTELKNQLLIQEVRISLAECELPKPSKTKKPSEDQVLSYFNKKSLCLREVYPKLKDAPSPLRSEWCTSYHTFAAEIPAASTDKFVRLKLTQDYANPSETVECNEPTSSKR